MKLKCKQSELIDAIQTAQPAVATKTTLPILGNFLLHAEEKTLTINGTDLEICVQVKCKADVDEKGSITIPAKLFSQIVQQLPGPDVEIQSKDEKELKINSGGSKIKLLGMSTEEYPALPVVSQENLFEINSELLDKMIRNTLFAVSSEESRYVLCGVYFAAKDGNIEMVSTDGRRLAYISESGQVDKKLKFGVIIPSKTANEWQRIISMSPGKVKISVEDNQVGLVANDTEVVSRLIEGTYPNYEQVIPKKTEVAIKIPREPLLQSTRRVGLMTTEKWQAVVYKFEKGKLSVSARAEGLGEAVDEIKVDYDGQEMEVAYNPRFISDALKNVDTNDVILEMTTPLNPGVLKPDGKANYLCVIMPMHI